MGGPAPDATGLALGWDVDLPTGAGLLSTDFLSIAGKAAPGQNSPAHQLAKTSHLW